MKLCADSLLYRDPKGCPHKQILNLTTFFFFLPLNATSHVKCTDCDDLFGIYVAVV